MSRKLKIFITSADHFVGHHVARTLASDKFKQHFERISAGGMDEKAMEDLKRMGIHTSTYKLEDRGSMERCFKGHDVVYIIPAHEENRVEGARNMIDACKNSGVKNILLKSVVKADEAQQGSLKEYCEIEQYLQKSNVEHRCVMRVGIFMQTFLVYTRQVQQSGELPVATGEGKFAPIDLKDMARFVACLLSGKHRRDGDDEDEDDNAVAGNMGMPYTLPDEHHGKCYCLTGPEALTGEQIVQRASQAIGAQLKSRQVDRRETEKIIRESGQMKEKEMHLLLDMYEMVKQNKYNEVTRDFEKVVGKKPRKVEEFFSEHSKDFKPQQ